jgi:hypothetical protein
LIIVSNALPLRCTSTSYPYEFEWDEDSLLYQARNGISVCGSEGTPTVMFIGQLGIEIEGRYQDVSTRPPTPHTHPTRERGARGREG